MGATVTDQQLSELSGQLAGCLRGMGGSLVTAESCTGGWVAKLVTEVAGSSAWFDRGYVTYSNAAKQDMLGVSAALLEAHGAVSAEVAAAMTAGALESSHADWALAISGIAGPEGGTDAKPVGTVWVAWQERGTDAETDMKVFGGDRDAIRRGACALALQGLIDRISQPDLSIE